MTAAEPTPAAFLPPPKRERKDFIDEPLFPLGGVLAEVSDTHGCAKTLAELRAAVLEEKPWLTKPLATLHEERRLARAVSALLERVPR